MFCRRHSQTTADGCRTLTRSAVGFSAPRTAGPKYMIAARWEPLARKTDRFVNRRISLTKAVVELFSLHRGIGIDQANPHMRLDVLEMPVKRKPGTVVFLRHDRDIAARQINVLPLFP